MNTYYVLLPKIWGVFMNDVSHANWSSSEKKKLVAQSYKEALIEAKDLFIKNRDEQCGYVDHRFTEEHRQMLISDFPKTYALIEEIEHIIIF